MLTQLFFFKGSWLFWRGGPNPIIFEKRQPLLKHLVPTLEALEKSPTGSKWPVLHIWMPSLDPWKGGNWSDTIASGTWWYLMWQYFFGGGLGYQMPCCLDMFVCCLLFCFVSAVLFVQFSMLRKLLIHMLMWIFTMFFVGCCCCWCCIMKMMNCLNIHDVIFLNACRYRQNYMLISNASPFQKWLYMHQLYMAYTANISQVLLNIYILYIFVGSSS